MTWAALIILDSSQVGQVGSVCCGLRDLPSQMPKHLMHAHHPLLGRRRAAREGTGSTRNRTAGEVLSDLARQALTGQLGPPTAVSPMGSIHSRIGAR